MPQPVTLSRSSQRLLRAACTLFALGLCSSPQSLLSAAAPETPRAQPVRSCAQSLGQLQPLRAQELGNELEVLSWNIQKAASDSWASDLADFGADVDLAFIQEASRQAGIETILPTAVHTSFARGYVNEGFETGVMTLSRGLPSLRCMLTAREPWLGTPKATSVTEYALRGRDDRLLAINLHAVNFTLGVADFRAQFQALTDLLARHRGPVILAGDLNTWSKSREAVALDFLQAHGLKPVEFEDDRRTTAFGRALDHIFVRGLSSRDARVIPVRSSDHNALRVGLTVMEN